MSEKDRPSYEELERKVRELEDELELRSKSISWEILTLLARQWDMDGPPGIIENSEIIVALNLSRKEAAASLKELSILGITSNDTMGYGTYLTPEGYDIAKNRDQETPLDEQIHNMRKW